MAHTRQAIVGFSGRNRLQRAISICRLPVQSLVMCVPYMLIWHVMYVMGWQHPMSAEGPITNADLPILATGHFVLAAFLLGVSGTKAWDAIIDVFESGDDEKFLRLVRRQATPPPPKAVLFVTGIVVNSMRMSLPVHDYWSSFVLVLKLAFVISLIWEMLAEVESPVDGIWGILNIPGDLKRKVKDMNLPKRRTDRLWEWLANRVAPANGN